jgi:hydroxypyruvate reductase
VDPLTRIFQAALDRADPYRMLVEHVTLDGETLSIQFEGQHQRVDLSQFRRVYVFGAGKASARMAQAVEAILGERITAGVVAVKYGHTAPLSRVRLVEAAHPVPDANSLRAAAEIAELARDFDERTLVINLVSGGGSALFDGLQSYPDGERTVQLTLDDLRATTQALLACGAEIGEINCIRKHLSTVKGGRLARRLYPATLLSFILSDVIGDRLDAIASGLTVPDRSTFGEAAAVVRKYGLEGRLPPAVARLIELGAAGQIDETPKPGDPAFERCHNLLIGTLYHSLLAAQEQARALGYHPLVLTSQLTGEAREAAKFLLGIAKDVKKRGLLAEKPACLIAGGETTVTLSGGGKGGRNQEMALAFLAELKADPAGAEGIYFLSASTDGSDGPTDAAGAFASLELLERAAALGLDPAAFLAIHDSYHFFAPLGALLKTGPTGTNVCDVQVILVE